MDEPLTISVAACYFVKDVACYSGPQFRLKPCERCVRSQVSHVLQKILSVGSPTLGARLRQRHDMSHCAARGRNIIISQVHFVKERRWVWGTYLAARLTSATARVNVPLSKGRAGNGNLSSLLLVELGLCNGWLVFFRIRTPQNGFGLQLLVSL